MRQAFNDVLTFMRVARQGFAARPTVSKPGIGETAYLKHAQAECHARSEKLREVATDSVNTVTGLRARLMLEELSEVLAGMINGDAVAVADGLADLCYVTIGTAIAYGIDLPAVWAAVQAANLAKASPCPDCGGHGVVGPPKPAGEAMVLGRTVHIQRWQDCVTCNHTGLVMVKDATGKVQKPAGWQPPGIAAVLAAQGEIGEMAQVATDTRFYSVRSASGDADPWFTVKDGGAELAKFDPTTLQALDETSFVGRDVLVVYVADSDELGQPPKVVMARMERSAGVNRTPHAVVDIYDDRSPVRWEEIGGKVYPIEAFPILAARWVAKQVKS